MDYFVAQNAASSLPHSQYPPSGLLLTESYRLLNGPSQFLLQCIESLVGWQIETVETGVRFWQCGLVLCLFDSEASRSITTLEILEAVDWNARGTSGELKQT